MMPCVLTLTTTPGAPGCPGACTVICFLAIMPPPWRLGVAERDSHGAGEPHDLPVARDLLLSCDRLLDRHGTDVRRVQAHHASEPALHHQLDRFGAETRREYAVERGRAAASLQVAQDGHPGLHPTDRLDLRRYKCADPAENGIAARGRPADHLAVGQVRALRDHDDAELLAGLASLLDPPDDGLVGEIYLGDQDDVTAPGYARHQSYPTRVAPHHLEHHDPVVRLRRGVEPVEGVRCAVQRRVETEGDVRPHQVVVDGLRDTYHVDALFEEIEPDGLAAVPAGDDQRIDAGPLDIEKDPVGAVPVGDLPVSADLGAVEGVGLVTRPQDGPSAREDARDVVLVQQPELVVDQPTEAVQHPHGLHAVVQGGPGHGPDDGVQARAIAPAGQQTYSAYLRQCVLLPQ